MKCASKHQWRLDFYTILSHNLAQWDAPEIIRPYIDAAVRQSLEGTPIPDHLDAEWAEQQRRCGWDQILYGRWVTKIRTIANPNDNPATPAPRWLIRTVSFMWGEFHKLWKKRNLTVHPDVEETDAQKIEALRSTVHTLYQYESFPNLATNVDNTLFNITEDERMQSPLHEIQNWISLTSAVIKDSLSASERERISHRTQRPRFRPSRTLTPNNPSGFT
jgi:hypothetical protein